MIDLPYPSCGEPKESIWTSGRKLSYEASIALKETNQTHYSRSGPAAVSYTSQSQQGSEVKVFLAARFLVLERLKGRCYGIQGMLRVTANIIP